VADSILDVRNLISGYGKVETLHGVNVTVPSGGITSVIGPNGSGKSSLLKAVCGLIKVWSGEVILEGNDITNTPANKLVYQGVTMVPQGRVVFPTLTVEDNLKVNAFSSRDKQVIAERLERAFEFLPILRERRGQYAGNLSGGEQVMLSVAKALMQNPKLLVLDEPSLGLSPKMVDFIYERVQTLAREGVDVLVVEQNVRKALEISDHVVVLVLGEVRYEGGAKNVNDEIDLGRLFLEGKIA